MQDPPSEEKSQKPEKPGKAGQASPKQIDHARALASRRDKLVTAKTEQDAILHALDLVRYSRGKPKARAEAEKVVLEMLGQREAVAHAVLSAMKHDRTAWPGTVPRVLAVLGNGSERLIAAATLVVQVWLERKGVGDADGDKCIQAVYRQLEITKRPPNDQVKTLRGAIRVAEMRKRLADIEPLIGLLEIQLRLETKMRVAEALEAITLNRLCGMSAQKWRTWAETNLDEGATLARVRAASMSQALAHSHAKELEGVRRIRSLSVPDLERIEGHLQSVSPDVVRATIELAGELYAAVTDEAERLRVQARLLPMVLARVDDHREAVVVAVLRTVDRLSKPTVTDEVQGNRTRAALLKLAEHGTPPMRSGALTALGSFADRKDTSTVGKLLALIDKAEAWSERERVALVTTIGAYATDESAQIFVELFDRSKSDKIRVVAAKNALRVKLTANAIVERIAEQLSAKKGSAEFRHRLTEALGYALEDHQDVVSILGGRLADLKEATDIRLVAADSLGYAKKQRAPAAAKLHEQLKALDATEAKLTPVIMRSLGRLGHVAAAADVARLRTMTALAGVRDAADDALVDIAASDPKQTIGVFDMLAAAGVHRPIERAYEALELLENGSSMKELDKVTKRKLTMRYVEALATNEGEALARALEKAMAKVDAMIERDAADSAALLAKARLLLFYPDDKSRMKELAAIDAKLPATAPAGSEAAVERELLKNWVRLRTGEHDKAAARLRDMNAECLQRGDHPLMWQHAVATGHAALGIGAVHSTRAGTARPTDTPAKGANPKGANKPGTDERAAPGGKAKNGDAAKGGANGAGNGSGAQNGNGNGSGNGNGTARRASPNGAGPEGAQDGGAGTAVVPEKTYRAVKERLAAIDDEKFTAAAPEWLKNARKKLEQVLENSNPRKTPTGQGATGAQGGKGAKGANSGASGKPGDDAEKRTGGRASGKPKTRD